VARDHAGPREARSARPLEQCACSLSGRRRSLFEQKDTRPAGRYLVSPVRIGYRVLGVLGDGSSFLEFTEVVDQRIEPSQGDLCLLFVCARLGYELFELSRLTETITLQTAELRRQQRGLEAPMGVYRGPGQPLGEREVIAPPRHVCGGCHHLGIRPADLES
jgi:hypothetical protein